MRNFFVTICVLLCSLLFYGNIYFWTDENGVKHFSNVTATLNKTLEELKETQPVFQKHPFKVLKIYDGDTIKVSGLDLTFKVRLVGIDSPEIGFNGQPSQPFAKMARRHLIDLLDEQMVAVKSYGTGGYNRQLAEVFVGDKNINLEMIKAGLAQVYRGKRPQELDSKRYFAEESKARRVKKRMWDQGKSYKSPWQWRKEHPRK